MASNSNQNDQQNNNYSILKWGIVGAGKISNDFVSAVLSDQSPKHQFIAVASKSLNSAKTFADRFQINKSYGSYVELANDSDVQVVYIGNLNVEHFDTAKLFLEHGKHVLLEKPMTMNAKQTETITKLAKEKNLFLMEALWSRFFPSYVFIREQIKNGAIGEPLYATASFGIPISDVHRIKTKECGGGTILDLAIYPLNVLQMAFDNETPEKILACGHLSGPNGVDLNMSAVLNYANGKTGAISTHSKVYFENEASIFGTKGQIKMLPWFHSCEKVIINGQLYDFLMPEESKFKFNFTKSIGLKFEAEEVRRVLANGKIESDIMPHRHSIIFAKILDEIRLQLGVHFDADD